jgi:hypothetical protein
MPWMDERHETNLEEQATEQLQVQDKCNPLQRMSLKRKFRTWLMPSLAA